MNRENRYEIKYILDNSKLSEVNQWLYKCTFASKSYPMRRVNSLYFDDVNYSSVRDNLAGISNRKKLRLRWYGFGKTEFHPSFEIKSRDGRLGYKKTFPIKSLEENLMELNVKEILFRCTTELNKLNIIFDHHLVPTLQTSFEREYFVDHDGIRITIDKNIKFYNSSLYKKLKKNLDTNYPYHVMEIKFSPTLKDNVAAIIKDLHLTPKRHSKYLVGMSALGFSVYI